MVSITIMVSTSPHIDHEEGGYNISSIMISESGNTDEIYTAYNWNDKWFYSNIIRIGIIFFRIITNWNDNSDGVSNSPAITEDNNPDDSISRCSFNMRYSLPEQPKSKACLLTSTNMKLNLNLP